jgi:hypothetical protein
MPAGELRNRLMPSTARSSLFPSATTVAGGYGHAPTVQLIVAKVSGALPGVVGVGDGAHGGVIGSDVGLKRPQSAVAALGAQHGGIHAVFGQLGQRGVAQLVQGQPVGDVRSSR